MDEIKGFLVWTHSYIIILTVGTEMVPEMVALDKLTLLIVQDNFIDVNHRESSTSYTFLDSFPHETCSKNVPFLRFYCILLFPHP